MKSTKHRHPQFIVTEFVIVCACATVPSRKFSVVARLLDFFMPLLDNTYCWILLQVSCTFELCVACDIRYPSASPASLARILSDTSPTHSCTTPPITTIMTHTKDSRIFRDFVRRRWNHTFIVEEERSKRL